MNVDDELPTPLSIPSPFTSELVARLLPFTKVQTYLAGRRLILSSKNVHLCCLIVKGKYQFHRQADGLVVAFGSGPTILGIGNFTNLYLDSYIKTLTACEIGIMSTDEALKLIESENLWHILAEHLLVISAKFYTVAQQLSTPTSYEIVRSQIMELMSEDAFIRNSMTVETYIRKKTNLSRSFIMRILSSLKKGGYIELQRGMLIKINSLPKKY
jgi:hypothetical protein